MNGVIHEYRPEDAQAIADIYNESIIARLATLDTEEKTRKDILDWVNGFNNREVILVMERNENIIGWGIIKRYSDRLGYNSTCETAVYIAATEKGKGFGPIMKMKLIEKCKEFGYHHLVAKIWSTNLTSIEYNKKMGYEIVGTQREVGISEGKWIDVVIMQLVLDDVIPENIYKST